MLLHNRLTHSLKVEQVGLSLYSKLVQGNAEAERLLSRDAIAAACLAHDLGHPPFGHAGEQELHKLVTCRLHRDKARPLAERRADPCTKCTLEDGFEGNAQSFRIVTALAIHKSFSEAEKNNFWGVDLTSATLRATSKYPWTRGDGPKQNKWGAYDLDAAVLEELTDGSKELTLDAQVMDWADDISYAVHDLEDFYRSGHIPLELYSSQQEHRQTDELEEFLAYVESVLASKVSAEARAAFDGLRGLLPPKRFGGDPLEISQVDDLRSRMLTQFINAASVEDEGLILDALQKEVNGLVKQFTWYYVIDNPELANIQAGQRRVLSEIFFTLKAQVDDVYLSRNRDSVDPRMERRLPSALRWFVRVALGQNSEEAKPTRAERVHRGLVDYIAGLSDSEAYEQHAVLKGREPQGHL